MDDALKRRLRTSFRRWERACPHCGYSKKAKALAEFQAACDEAVAYANTLAFPDEYGTLRSHGSFFPNDIASWSGGFATGVMKGDDFDGGPRAWYWRVPKKGLEQKGDIHWKDTPGDALVDLVEHLEAQFGPRVGSSQQGASP